MADQLLTDPGGEALAIDIGGSKIAVALVDNLGRLTNHQQVATPQGTSDQVWAAIADLVSGDDFTGARGIGVCSAGPINSHDGTVSPLNIGSWSEFPLADQLRSLTGLEVLLVGDGIAAAVGEHWLGAASDVNDAVVVVVSTGVGGGVISQGKIVTGRTGNAAHLGHVVVDFNGTSCVCGGRGCAEMYASGRAMVSNALAAGWDGGTTRDGVALFEAVRQGNVAATNAVHTGAKATAAVIDLRVAVLGGGVLQAADVFVPLVRQYVTTYATMDFLAGMSTRAADLGNHAGLIGAARLVFQPELL
ncbi:MAG: ROK family protein [Acidimicrobiales bacterium]